MQLCTTHEFDVSFSPSVKSGSPLRSISVESFIGTGEDGVAELLKDGRLLLSTINSDLLY